MVVSNIVLFSALVGGKDSHVDLYVSSGFKPPTTVVINSLGGLSNLFHSD